MKIAEPIRKMSDVAFNPLQRFLSLAITLVNPSGG